MEKRRTAKFVTPIPKPKKRKDAVQHQKQFVFDEGKGISTAEQGCHTAPVIDELLRQVDRYCEER